MSVAPQMRGRVMALYMMIFMGGTPIGAPIVGWVGQTFGARWTLIGGGVATMLGTLFAVVVFALAKGLIGPGHAQDGRPDPGHDPEPGPGRDRDVLVRAGLSR